MKTLPLLVAGFLIGLTGAGCDGRELEGQEETQVLDGEQQPKKQDQTGFEHRNQEQPPVERK